MTFTHTREGVFSTFQVLELDLTEILDISRDILNDKDKDSRGYLKEFDYPEIEYSTFDADIEGGRQ